jgi:hypothetical protein
MSFRIFLVLLLLGSKPAYAQWVTLGQTSEATIYVDPETIHSTEGTVEVSFVFDYKRRQRLDDELNYLSTKRLYEFECGSEWFRLLAVTFFMGDMGKGHVIEHSVKEDRWRPVPPTGVGRSLLKFACKPKQ